MTCVSGTPSKKLAPEFQAPEIANVVWVCAKTSLTRAVLVRVSDASEVLKFMEADVLTPSKTLRVYVVLNDHCPVATAVVAHALVARMSEPEAQNSMNFARKLMDVSRGLAAMQTS